MNSTENIPVQIGSDRNPGLTVLGYTTLVSLLLIIVIYITLSVKHVTVETENKKLSFLTLAPTVSGVLKEAGIGVKFGPDKEISQLKEGESLMYYSLSCNLNQEIKDGAYIKITHNYIKKFAEKTTIAAPVRRERDFNLESGKQRVKDPGQEGVIKDIIMVYYRDGKLVSKEKIASNLIVKPKPTVIVMGSYEVASRQGPVRSGKAYKFEATAYTHTGHRTATGAKTRRGIVAVDPRVIPLGSKLYIEGYGYGVAADTGGAIKGRKIDVFTETESEAIKWGRRYVKVYILSK